MKQHSDFYPPRAQVQPGKQPLETEFHDVLVIPPLRSDGQAVIADETFFRFGVVKSDPTPKNTGKYVDPPELWGKDDLGQRKIIGIAHPEHVQPGAQDPRGPAFAALPIKAEPGASSCAFCYLIDARNLVSPNAWTAEEWDAPRAPDLGAAAGANATEAEVLLALPRGIVLRLKASKLDALDTVAKPDAVQVNGNGVTYEIEPVQLKREPEIWNQLRNGTIAGRALYRALQGGTGGQRVLPLVNVTSLTPEGAGK